MTNIRAESVTRWDAKRDWVREGARAAVDKELYDFSPLRTLFPACSCFGWFAPIGKCAVCGRNMDGT